MKKNSLLTCFAASAAVLALLAGFAHAQTTISVNFSASGGAAGVDAPILASDVVGVVAVANWNDAAGSGGGPLSGLVDDSGAATTAVADWSSSASWGGTADPAPTDPAEAMMTTWLDNGGPLTVTGIPYSAYDVYIYGSSDGAGNAGKTLGWNVNGSDFASIGTFQNTSLNGDFYNGVFVDGSTADDDPDYVKISGLAGNLTILDHTNANGITRSGVSGIQIVEATIEASIRLNINRDNGNVTLTNNTGSSVELAAMSILSNAGALSPADWNSVSDSHDEGAAGGISGDKWIEVLATSSELSEGTLGVGTLAHAQTIDFGNAWSQYIDEEVTFEYLDANNGNTVQGSIIFSGTTQTEAFVAGDYNFDGSITSADWPTQRDNYSADLSNMPAAARYAKGDFDRDGDNDIDDVKAFKVAFLAGGGSLSELSSVPEPTSILLLAMAALLFVCRRTSPASLIAYPRTRLEGSSGRERLNNQTVMGRALNSVALLFAFVAVLLTPTPAAYAQSIAVSYAGDNTGATSVQITPTQTAGVVPQSSWNAASGSEGSLLDLVDNTGATTQADATWSSANTWGGTGATTGDEAMVNGWLDDGAAGSLSTITNIPYDLYDVYIYGSSDAGNGGRGWAVTVNGTQHTSAGGVFGADVTANGSFFDGTYVNGDSGAENPSYVFASAQSGDLTILGLRTSVDGLDSRGAVSGFQIVEVTGAPPVLILEINTDTGVGIVKNTTGGDIDFDFYEITSDPSASLNLAGWNSIQETGQNGFPKGDGSGNGWEKLGGANLGNDLLAEQFLNGESSLADGESFSLGNIFDTSSGVEEDIKFQYTDLNTFTRSGLVKFVTGTDPGDFDGDGNVDGNDFLTWQRGAHSTSDLNDWKANFGGGGSLSASTSVPEPSSLLLLLLAVGATLTTVRRHQQGRQQQGGPFMFRFRRSLVHATMGCLALAWLASQSLVGYAVVFNDREYSFGEDPLETAAQGATVGGNSVAANTSLDSAGTTGTGTFLDLTQSGGATYQDVDAIGGLNRPGANNGDFGVRFDGVNDRLTGVPLNRPDELKDILTGGYSIDYTDITTRGLQAWVYPDQAALDAGTYQSIVFDTIFSGGPAINEQGQWTQINSFHGDAANGIGQVPATVDVPAGNTWYHVMHHNFANGVAGSPKIVPGSGAAQPFTSVLYVDGIAVSANNDNINIGGDGDFAVPVGFLVVGAAELDTDNDNTIEGFGNFFTGVVDDLDMYVYGGTFGEFNLVKDNEWIQQEIVSTVPGGVLKAGDVNRDGSVSGDGTGPAASDDVTALINGWRREKVIAGAHSSVAVGDWETWTWGDLNSDGTVDFSDWYLLRESHPNGGLLDLGGLLEAHSVPEPTSILLMLASVLGGLGCVRRR